MKPKKICIVGASGKLGQYMIEHALAAGYDVSAVCREQSLPKLARFVGRIQLHGAPTDDADTIRRASAGCDAVLTVLVPWGMERYASGTATAVLEQAPRDARLIFSCGWHISRDGQDRYSWKLKAIVAVFGRVARWLRVAELDDQVRATNLIFNSDRRWTVVRGSDLDEGPSEGLPIWSQHVGDAALSSNRTRRTDFALFMVHAVSDDELIQQAPAICSCQSESALAFAPSH
ncbi:NAD(P)-dependent oxidoreductase [Saccharospirillum mangrovi]|uniref:NAD(P)-dependent oxidoreductase n=1 Tax=Saccharospirillum mangrovi TaxID=2161747 RepID=UPI000D369938|nr:NAD(P)H-binding protein [Saccharospirillum mangrovi]